MSKCYSINPSKLIKQKKKFEKYLYWLIDHHFISEWFYNGSYHVTFKDLNVHYLYDNFGARHDK